MANQIWGGLAEGVSPFAKAIADSRIKRADDQKKREANQSGTLKFIDTLKAAGINLDQLSSVNPEEGTVGFRQPGLDLPTMIALMGGQAPQTQPTQPQVPDGPAVPTTTPQGEGFESLPIINRLTGLFREAGRGTGFRETQRGITQSLQARATPALKALGEVGVLTDQDVARILGGGFASDSDTVESRFQKRRGMTATFDEKEKVLMNVLNQASSPQVSSIGGRSGGRLILDPAMQAAKKKAQQDLIQLRQARGIMDQIFNEADSQMPAIGASKNGNQPAQAQGGKVRVRRISDGTPGSINPADFDPAKYERL